MCINRGRATGESVCARLLCVRDLTNACIESASELCEEKNESLQCFSDIIMLNYNI